MHDHSVELQREQSPCPIATRLAHCRAQGHPISQPTGQTRDLVEYCLQHTSMHLYLAVSLLRRNLDLPKVPVPQISAHIRFVALQREQLRGPTIAFSTRASMHNRSGGLQ